MALIDLFRRKAPPPVPARTDATEVELSRGLVEPDPTESTPSPTQSDLVEPTPTKLVLGSITSAREQAAALLHALVDTGYTGKTLSVDQLCGLHHMLSEKTDCIPRGWLAIARELKRMGLRKVKLWRRADDGPVLVTFYEIAEPPDNVVDLAAVERRRV
jgi:hypothetical protein